MTTSAPRPPGLVPAPPPSAAVGLRPPGPRFSRWLLAAALTAHALAAVAQPVLIGGYLEGHFDLLQAHGLNGSLLTFLSFVAMAAAALYWARRGHGWPTLVMGVLWFAEWVQLVLGYTRVLWVHVLLGALIVAGSVAIAAWGWSPRSGRARRGWWR